MHTGCDRYMVKAVKTKYMVIIYVRKSRLKDDDAMEIDRQIELLIEYAKSNNMEYIVFKEEGSSEDWNRPELQKMITELEKGIYDGVLVTEQDRISRDSTDMGLFKRLCKKHSMYLFTLNKVYNFLNDEDDFMSGIQAEMDAHFMRITKRKLMRGRIQALEEGVYFGIPPLGYDKSDTKPKKLIINEDKAEIIRLIFDLYVNKKWNQTEIAERLNLLGYKTLYNKPFTVRATSLILSNEAYIGTMRYELSNREPIVVDNAHPAIIDEDTFNKAQIILSKRRNVPQDSRRGTYILSKLLKCPNCKTTLSFSHSFKSSTKREEGKELYILNCYASSSAKKKMEIKKNPNTACTNYGSVANYVEDKVFKMLEEHLDELEAKIDELVINGDNLFKDVHYKIDMIINRINQLDKERKRVQDGYKDGIYESDEAKELLNKIKEDKIKLEHEKIEVEQLNASSEIDKLKERKEKIIDLLSNDSYDNKKINTILREIIDCIWYKKEIRGNHLKPHHPTIAIKYK